MRKFIFGVIALMVSALFFGAVYNPSIKESPDDKECREHSELMRAFKDVIHRVYIDRPDYVENILVRSEEFKTLDSLLDGDWDDVFYFYNQQDSIDYYSHIEEWLSLVREEQ